MHASTGTEVTYFGPKVKLICRSKLVNYHRNQVIFYLTETDPSENSEISFMQEGYMCRGAVNLIIF